VAIGVIRWTFHISSARWFAGARPLNVVDPSLNLKTFIPVCLDHIKGTEVKYGGFSHGNTYLFLYFHLLICIN